MKTDKIQIFDTTLRDGEQVPGCQLSPSEKETIAEKLEDLGVDVIEAGFPISSPGDFEAVERVAKVVKNASVCALTRANTKDIDSAVKALEKANNPRIHTGIGTSDQHVFTKLKMTREQILEKADMCVSYAKKYVNDVEFYAEDAGRTDIVFLTQVIQTAVNAGATVVNIPDTTGYCLPDDYGKKIDYLSKHIIGIENVTISTHCHNDLGLATANAIAGVQHGARQIECTLNGIGERAGNTSLEEVVMILNKQNHLPYYTDINTPQLNPVSAFISDTMGMPVQPNKAIVGANAFAHSSGIHQDGVIKNRENYEIIAPEEVGAQDSKIVLTARSGRAALTYRMGLLGFETTREHMTRIYTDFLTLADKVKQVEDGHLKEMINRINKIGLVGV